MNDRPTWCARCRTSPRQRATHLVQGLARAEVVCDRHLTASLTWAGPGAKAYTLPGHDPPPEQPALF